MKNLILVGMAICTLSFAPGAQAGKELGNGGSAAALGFYEVIQSVLKDIQIESAKYPELVNIHLDAIAKDTSFIVSEEPLLVEHNGIHQESTAVNFKNPYRILIHRESWMKLSEKEKKTIAFHEILSLAGLEETGNYRISQRYYSQNQVSLYDCSAVVINHTSFALNFVLSDDSSTRGVYLDTPFTAQGAERFYMRMGPGHLDPFAPNPDSVVIIISRLRKSSNDWDISKTTNFFGEPKLPRKFQMELDAEDANSSAINLTCTLKN
jgi:hypothetical protein